MNLYVLNSFTLRIVNQLLSLGYSDRLYCIKLISLTILECEISSLVNAHFSAILCTIVEDDKFRSISRLEGIGVNTLGQSLGNFFTWPLNRSLDTTLPYISVYLLPTQVGFEGCCVFLLLWLWLALQLISLAIHEVEIGSLVNAFYSILCTIVEDDMVRSLGSLSSIGVNTLGQSLGNLNAWPCYRSRCTVIRPYESVNLLPTQVGSEGCCVCINNRLVATTLASNFLIESCNRLLDVGIDCCVATPILFAINTDVA